MRTLPGSYKMYVHEVVFGVIGRIGKLRNLSHRSLFYMYLSEAIKMFGVSMISVFETIYLYLFFLERYQDRAASAVFVFFAVFFGLFGVLSPFGAHIASRFGFAKINLISTPFLFCYFLFLLLLPNYPWLLIPTLFAIVIRASLFWPGFHLLFATSSSYERRGMALSRLAIASSVASILGPPVGGQIIAHFGYPPLFILVLPFVCLSAVPLFFIPWSEHVSSDGLGRTLTRLFRAGGLSAGIAFIASGAEEEANGRIWPLFLFILAISYSSLGIIVALSTAFSIVATLQLGRLTDHRDRIKLLQFGSFVLSGAWLIRGGVSGPLMAGLANVFYGVARAGYNVPFLAIFYDRSVAADSPFSAIVFREVMINVGRAVFLGTLAVIALWVKDFRILILASAVFPLFFRLIRYWKP